MRGHDNDDNGNNDLYDKSVYKQNNSFENEYEDFRSFQMFEASGSVKDYLLYRELLRRGTDDDGEDMFIDEEESWSDGLINDDDTDEF